jgi:N-methylhydantoinase A/oxoprolinase/acetone carboxylase beta subunit
LDEERVRDAARVLRDAGVESVAICFLFSYLNSAHEDRAKAIVSEILPDAFVTTSSFVSPQFREFERFTTAALAAFIGPKVRMYITRLDRSLKGMGLTADLRIMASNGGVATASMVSEKPTLTLLSGLAAGVLAGAWIGGLAERRKLITFDIGGTSADIGIIVDGRLTETDARSTSIAGFPLLTPMIDIHTIGAGGGSIAYIDHGGAFRVGPRSAGAVPGPAAYGVGGEEPTVTDANLVLGRLDADDFLGGGMKLDAEAARRAVGGLASKLGLGLGLSEAAEGILTVINANMANAIRSRTIQKGIDPRGFSLVAFGGAGPLQGAEVAAILDIPEVIVPPYPGITSAMGLLTTDFKYDAVQTEFQVSDAVDLKKLNKSLVEMQAGISARFDADHIPLSEVTFSRAGDLRYVGQGYELRVPLPDGEITEETLPQAWTAFHAAHAAEYGRAFEASPIEIVNIRVSGVGRVPKLRAMKAPEGGSLEKARTRVSPCLFRVGGKLESFETPFYRRTELPVEETSAGPAVILQTDSTTLVPPGATARVDWMGNIIITLRGLQ